MNAGYLPSGRGGLPAGTGMSRPGSIQTARMYWFPRGYGDLRASTRSDRSLCDPWTGESERLKEAASRGERQRTRRTTCAREPAAITWATTGHGGHSLHATAKITAHRAKSSAAHG